MPNEPKNMSTSAMRVRLFFDCERAKSVDLHSTKCWMMLNFNTCMFVKDLKQAIVERFFRNKSVKLSLYIDDFILPSEEVIQIIHENDIIRVQVSHLDAHNICRSPDEYSQQCSSSRDNQECDDDVKRKKKKKKRKRKLPNDETSDSNPTVEDSSSSTKQTSPKTESKSSKKHKRCKITESVDVKQNAVETEKDITKNYIKDGSQKNDIISSEKKKKKKHQDKSDYLQCDSQRNARTKSEKKKKKNQDKCDHIEHDSQKNDRTESVKSPEDFFFQDVEITETKSVECVSAEKKVKDKTKVKARTFKGLQTLNEDEKISARQAKCKFGEQKLDVKKKPKMSESVWSSRVRQETPKQKSTDNKIIDDKIQSEARKDGLTKQDISKIIDITHNNKNATKNVGQRLLEISQEGFTKQDILETVDKHKSILSSPVKQPFAVSQKPSLSVKSKIKPEKSKGHIRFSSSEDSSSESSSDSSSESGSESTLSGDGKNTSAKAKPLPALNKPLPALNKPLPALNNHMATKCVTRDLKSTTDSTNCRQEPVTLKVPEHLNIDKPLQHTRPKSSPASSWITTATENGIRGTLNRSLANQGVGPWQRNQGGGRRQGHWNPMSKKGQLNTKLTNTSTVIRNPEGGQPNSAAGDAVLKPPSANTPLISPRPDANTNITHTNLEIGETKVKAADVVPEKPKDYSTYPPLVGPPRAGDKIAYKILELSNVYCPEVSDYKEAEVLSYSSEGQLIEVKLKSASHPARRQGRFELHFDDENDEQLHGPTSDMVSIQLTSLLEPKLL